MTLETMGARIKSELQEKRYTYSELAQTVGVSPAAISQWINGQSRNIKNETLQKVADALNVSISWLITGKGSKTKTNIITVDEDTKPPLGFVEIKMYKINFGAGATYEPTYEEITESTPAVYSIAWLEHKGVDYRYCKRFKVRGDSMQPLIMDGDSILVDCSEDARTHIISNGLYAISYDNLLMVKRLIKPIKGGLIIHSDNPAFPDEQLTDQEANELFHVIGHVLERSGSIS